MQTIFRAIASTMPAIQITPCCTFPKQIIQLMFFGFRFFELPENIISYCIFHLFFFVKCNIQHYFFVGYFQYSIFFDKLTVFSAVNVFERQFNTVLRKRVKPKIAFVIRINILRTVCNRNFNALAGKKGIIGRAFECY